MIKPIIYGKKLGKTDKEIGKEMGYSKSYIKDIVRQLINNGELTKDEIEEAIKRREEENANVKHNTIIVNEKLEKEVLRLLLLGVSTIRICNELKVDIDELNQIKDNLKKRGDISDKEIKESVEEKRKRDKKIIYKLLLLGYYNNEMIEDIPYSEKSYIGRLILQLKKDREITDEQIAKARYERNIKYKKKIVLEGLQQGLSYEEISRNYEEKIKDIEGIKDKTLSKKAIGDWKIKLVEENVITDELIQERRKNRDAIKSEERKEQHVGLQDEKILELFKLGFNEVQIEKITDLGRKYILRIKRNLISKGKITEVEIQSSIENRQNEAKKRQTHIAKMIGFTRKIDENVIQTHLDYAKVIYKLDELKNKDIKLLRKVIPMDAKLVSFDSVNFILRVLTKQNNDTQAIEFIDECMLACEEDKKMCEKLQETRKQIENKIIQLKEKGRRIQEKSKIITHPQSPKDGLSAGDGWEH